MGIIRQTAEAGRATFIVPVPRLPEKKPVLPLLILNTGKMKNVQRESIEAYEQIKEFGKLPEKCLLVYKALCELCARNPLRDGFTDVEIAKHLKVPINEITGRMADLLRQGESSPVEVVSKREPDYGGAKCRHTWAKSIPRPKRNPEPEELKKQKALFEVPIDHYREDIGRKRK